MNVENLMENEVPTENAANQNKFKIGNPMVWLQLIIFLLGLGLLIFVIYRIGFQTIVEALGRIGWGILIIIALNGMRHLLRALCVYLAIPAQHHSFKYRYAVAARFAGEAVSFINFTGPLLGEATKAILLKKRVPLSHGVAAVVVDNILYDISVILLILGGIGTMFYVYGSGDTVVTYVLLGITAIAISAFIGIILVAGYQVKPMSWLIKKLAERKWLPRFIEAKTKHIYEIENNVYQFYTHRRKSFFAVLGLIFLAHVLSVCEVYAALYMLGFTAYPTTSYIIESLTKVINFAFSFVPGTIGVYEGGTEVILNSLGYATATGVTLALVRRGAILFWTFVGLVILLWRTISRGTRHLTKRG